MNKKESGIIQEKIFFDPSRLTHDYQKNYFFYFDKSYKSIPIPRTLARILLSFHGFKSLEEHLNEFVKSLNLIEKSKMYKEILKLFGKEKGEIILGNNSFQKMAGELLSKEHYNNLFYKEEDLFPRQPRRKNSIELFSILSSGNQSLLKNCLQSYSSNFKNYNRSPDILIINASEEEFAISENELQNHSELIYFGPEKRNLLCQHLINKSFDQDIIQFAFNPGRDLGVNTGSIRNIQLLFSHGRKCFSADDDTLCQFYDTQAEETINFSKNFQIPFQFENFLNFQSIEDIKSGPQQNLLAFHEKLLGKNLQELEQCAQFDAEDLLKTIELKQLKDLLNNSGLIQFCFNGLYGDSGSRSNESYLQNEKSFLKKNINNLNDIEKIKSNHLIRKFANNFKISQQRKCMTTFYSYDHSSYIPPFFPIFRMQDSIMMGIIASLSPSSYSAFLPFELLHVGNDSRHHIPQSIEKIKKFHFIRHYEVIDMAIESFQSTSFNDREKSAQEFFQFLFNILENWSQETKDRLHLRKRMDLLKLINLTEKNIDDSKHLPSYWKEELQANLNQKLNNLGNELIFGNEEYFQREQTPENAEKAFVNDLLKFAHLGLIWPEIVKSFDVTLFK